MIRVTFFCLIIAIIARTAMDQRIAAQDAVDGRASTAGRAASWLLLNDHSQRVTRTQAITINPCYTSLTSDYKPISHKLPDGRWEIVFVSEIAEDLP
jgi:hypothetical protein